MYEITLLIKGLSLFQVLPFFLSPPSPVPQNALPSGMKNARPPTPSQYVVRMIYAIRDHDGFETISRKRRDVVISCFCVCIDQPQVMPLGPGPIMNGGFPYGYTGPGQHGINPPPPRNFMQQQRPYNTNNPGSNSR